MSPWPVVLGLMSVLGASPAAAADPQGACLTSGEAWEAVSARKVVPSSRAIRGAREAAPRATVLRAALCRDPDALVYRVTVMRPDGRLLRVTVDAPSGKVTSVR